MLEEVNNTVMIFGKNESFLLIQHKLEVFMFKIIIIILVLVSFSH